MKIIPFSSESIADGEWMSVKMENVISGDPESTFKILYTSHSEEFTAGVYECTSGKWKVNYTEDEFCTLVEGRLIVTGDNGEVQEFSAPASFLIPSGFAGTWEAIGKLRKFFVIYEKTK